MLQNFRLRMTAFVTCCVLVAPTVLSAEDVAAQIQAALATSDGVSKNSVANTELEADIVVPKFYELRDFEPAWQEPQAADALFDALRSGLKQGFLRQDFHLDELETLRALSVDGKAEDIAKFDILATDAAVTLMHHLFFGKVDPAALDKDWNFSKPVIQSDPAVVLNQYLEGEGFPALMKRVALTNTQYLALIDALAEYQAISDAGGWPMVPDDEVLKPGMVSPAVAVLRERLQREGFIQNGAFLTTVTAEDTDAAYVYDDQLVEIVKIFQSRHGLDADGVIGPKTFASLNQPVADRINKLRLSLERGRWHMRGLDDEFVLVNIAGARTYLVKSDDTLWTTRSITGSEYRKTPVFRDEITYMEFNPTWTVPVSIFRKDKLPRIRKDPGYLARNNYIVRDRNGKRISASSVNWASNNPPVTLVQQPGPNNALGLVKFMFPNKYAVYLHDTDNRSLFDRNERNLSSGCVRIEYPFEFANLLMEGDPDWSSAKMQAILDSGKTTRVTLPKPMPVLLTYWTAWVEAGEIHFREDPYARDAALLAALNR